MEKLCSLIVKSETSKFQVRDAHSLESARVFTALAKIVKWTRLLQAVRKKYSASKFYNISTSHHLKSPVVNVFANKALKNWSCIVVHFSLIFFFPKYFLHVLAWEWMSMFHFQSSGLWPWPRICFLSIDLSFFFFPWIVSLFFFGIIRPVYMIPDFSPRFNTVLSVSRFFSCRIVFPPKKE